MVAEPFVAVRRDQIVVLIPDAADAGDIQTRLESHHVARDEHVLAFRNQNGASGCARPMP